MKRFKASWLVMLVTALTILAPLAATAEDETAPSEIDSRALEKAFAYAACAGSIVIASTGAGVFTAVLTCSAAINYWFSE